MRTTNCQFAVVFSLAVTFGAFNQAHSQDADELFAKNPGQFLDAVVKQLGFNDPAEPTKIVGPIYFVGTRGLGVWLITTSEGHIVLNTGMPGSGPIIEESIRKLRFDPKDIKLILTCHGHNDHVGGHKYLQELTGAQVAMIAEDAELLSTGGKSDFHYGNLPAYGFDAVKVDRVLRDGDTIKLGDVALTARLTPGHTKGATTWSTNVIENGKIYTVVFPDGTGINPGYRVANNPSYSGIGDDYRRTFHILESIKSDIWLTAHNEVWNLAGKRERFAQEGVRAWVDPEGYRRFVAGQREKFEEVVNKEMGTPARAK